jgi:hypothetical protein
LPPGGPWPFSAWQAWAAGRTDLELLDQNGVFMSLQGEQGEVMFPHPYASPPNVELGFRSGSSTAINKTLISKVSATGFKWKNTRSSEKAFSKGYFDGELTWKAKGVRANSLSK